MSIRVWGIYLNINNQTQLELWDFGLSILVSHLCLCVRTWARISPQKAPTNRALSNNKTLAQKRNNMKRESILGIIRDLAKSKGFYGRLYMDLMFMQKDSPEQYEEIMEELESKNFSDPVDLVLYIEC